MCSGKETIERKTLLMEGTSTRSQCMCRSREAEYDTLQIDRSRTPCKLHHSIPLSKASSVVSCGVGYFDTEVRCVKALEIYI